MKVNKWQITKNFINALNTDAVFTKREMKDITGVKITGTIGSYISHLKSLGYVNRIGEGTYRKVNNIPHNLTSSELEKMPW